MRFILKVKPFPVTIGVWCGEWEKEAITQFAKTLDVDAKSLDAPEDTNAGVCYRLDMATLIWIEEEPTTPRQIGFLAHEAFHAAENVADMVGIKHCDKSSEFYAYLTGYIVEETLKRRGKQLTTP